MNRNPMIENDSELFELYLSRMTKHLMNYDKLHIDDQYTVLRTISQCEVIVKLHEKLTAP